MPESKRKPIIAFTGEGKAWNVLGERIICKVAAQQSGGAYAVIEEITPPESGPPLHLHRSTTEVFSILQGEYEVVCGDLRFTAHPDTLFAVPKGVPHSLRNISASAARALVTLIPGGVEEFFAAVDGVTDPGKVVEIAQGYDIELLPGNL